VAWSCEGIWWPLTGGFESFDTVGNNNNNNKRKGGGGG